MQNFKVRNVASYLLKIAIKIDPKYALAYFNAANLYLSQKLWESAEEFYDKVFNRLYQLIGH